MAFGFPAYHTEELEGPADLDFEEAVAEAIHSLGWRVSGETETTIEASTGVNLWSWGERIHVRFHARGATLTSKCAMVTQCVDWGKNRSNVRRLIAACERFL